MKKISIVLAILAVFLVFGCSNAAGPIDAAGNPEQLTGTWIGTMAYKSVTKRDLPMSCIEDGSTNGYTDYAGTYVIESSFTAPADYTEPKVDGGATITYKHFFNMASTSSTSTYVVNSDGSYSFTTVETYTRLARAEQVLAPANTVYRVYSNSNDLSDYDDVTTLAEVTGYSYTRTYTGSQSAPVIREDLNYDVTRTGKTVTVTTVGGVTSSVTEEEPTTYAVLSDADFEDFYGVLPLEKRTVAPTLKPVEYQNDITESITFIVNRDGTYQLDKVIVTTQAAADAAAATATNYATKARLAGTKTETSSVAGTVAAWTVFGEFNNTTTMALSSGVETYSVAATEYFLDDNLNTPTVGKFAAAKEYNIRFFEGKAKKGETEKTRMYVSYLTDLDPDGFIAIFDKQVEEKK